MQQLRQIAWEGCEAALQNAGINETSASSGDIFATVYYMRYLSIIIIIIISLINFSLSLFVC